MRPKIVLAGLILSVSAGVSAAQSAPPSATPGQLYCSGVVTNESVPRDIYVITGEQSNYKFTFEEGDYIYVNKGSSQGVKVGDEFQVIRPVKDTIAIQWTKWQREILGKMGTVWEDEARAKVVVTQSDVSIAQLEKSCDFVQRGDIALPFGERPAPSLKSEANFDRLAPPNGKTLAMIVTGKKYQQETGTSDIAYVNLGSNQGVKVGDYFRIFRYQGTQHESVYQTPRYAFDVEGVLGPTVGFGRAPYKWDWKNVPRESLGEAVVLRTGPNSATVMVTLALREIYPGDYVELE